MRPLYVAPLLALGLVGCAGSKGAPAAARLAPTVTVTAPAPTVTVVATPVSTPSPTPALPVIIDSEVPVAPTAAPVPTPSVLHPGDAQEVYQDGAEIGYVAESAVNAVRTGDYGQRPSYGYFDIIVVQATAVGVFTVNPFDFYVRGPDGAHYGNTFMTNLTPPELAATTLNPGEHATGCVVFDVPMKSGFTLVYAPQGAEVGEWQY